MVSKLGKPGSVSANFFWKGQMASVFRSAAMCFLSQPQKRRSGDGSSFAKIRQLATVCRLTG